MSRKILILLTLPLMFLLAPLSASATTEHCPDHNGNPGKVEANGGTQAAINALVLDEGTVVCIKGSTDAVTVTADGVKTLKQLLGNDHDVSYYIIVSLPQLEAFICFEGEITTLTHTVQAELNLLVSLFLEDNEGAVQVVSEDAECVVETTTTTSNQTTPTTGNNTVTTTATITTEVVEVPVEVPVLRTAPAPTAAPLGELPRTGAGLGIMLGLGSVLTAAGILFRRLGK